MSVSSVAAVVEAPKSPAEIIRLRPRASKRPARPLAVRLDRAGFAVAALVVNAVSDSAGAGVHPPTVVAVLATLAAEQALQAAAVERRAPLEAAPGGWITGGPADAILFDCAEHCSEFSTGRTTVWNVVLGGILEAGMPDADGPDLRSVVAEAEAHAGIHPYPVYTVPPSHRPQGVPRASAARVRHEMMRHAADEGLCTAYECALVAGAALANVLRHDPEPRLLTQLAAEALIGAARQTPLPFAVR